MKINLIIPSFFPAVIYGGPIFSTLHTCEELAKIDDVEVFVSTTNTNMHSKLDVPTNQWQQFASRFFVKYYNETKVDKFSFELLFKVWRDIKNADVVHVQYIFSTPTPIALFYAKFFNKPIVLSSRGALCSWCLSQGSRFKKIWLKYLLKPLVSQIIWHATADQERDEILALFPNANISVIPNGIELETFKKSNALNPNTFTEKFAHKCFPTGKIIVSMGRLQKKKGFDILIDAFVDVLTHYPDAKLFIAGGDEGEEQSLLAQISRLGLEEKAFLVGAIDGQDKVDFLANADLFALPSHNENFGNVYIESLAAGTPIIASHGTPWAIVEDVRCGRWVENTPKDTADAMIDMLSRERETNREVSRKLADQYSWSSIAEQFHILYKKMVQS